MTSFYKDPLTMRAGVQVWRMPVAWAGAGLLALAVNPAMAAKHQVELSYSPNEQSWTVPVGVRQVTVTAIGGGGGGGGAAREPAAGARGGNAAKVQLRIDVEAGKTLKVKTGAGGRGGPGGSSAAIVGNNFGYGGGGGGSTAVSYDGARRIIAGGGGGGSSFYNKYFGAGGNGCPSDSNGGAGGAGTGGGAAGGGAGGAGGRNATDNPAGGSNNGNGGSSGENNYPAAGGAGGGQGAANGDDALQRSHGAGGGGWGGGSKSGQENAKPSGGGAGGSYWPARNNNGLSAPACVTASSGTEDKGAGQGGAGASATVNPGAARMPDGQSGSNGSVVIEWDDGQEIACNAESLNPSISDASVAIPLATVTAAGGQHGDITYSTSTGVPGNVCSWDAATGELSFSQAGRCIYTVNVAASQALPAAAPKQCSFPVGPARHQLSWGTDVSAPMAVGETKVFAVTGTPGVPISYAASGTGCSVDSVSGSVEARHAGQVCKVIATQAATDVNMTATLSYDVQINKGVPALTWGPTPLSAVVGAWKGPFAGESNVPSLGAVTLRLDSPESCAVSASEGVRGLKAGAQCTISLVQAGNDDYLPGLKTFTAEVQKGHQGLEASSKPSLKVGVAGGTLTVTSNVTQANGGGAISYTGTTPNVCTVDSASGAITALKKGSCIITAKQAANDNYNAASDLPVELMVDAGTKTLTWNIVPTLKVDGDGNLTATSSVPGKAIVYASKTADVCSVDSSSGAIHALKAGACTVTANQDADDDHDKAPEISQSMDVGLAKPVLTWGAVPELAVGDSTKTLTATSSVKEKGSAIAYASTTAQVCEIDASKGTIKVLKAGDCTITADQAAKASYYEAAEQLTKTMAIGKQSQTLTFNEASTASRKLVPGTTFEVAPLATSDHPADSRPVVYSSTSAAVCSVSGSTVTMLTAGVCTIAANQKGDDSYAAAEQKSQSVTLQGSRAFSGITVPGPKGKAGEASVRIEGGGELCSFDLSADRTGFVQSPGTLPAGQDAPHGMLKFQLVGCDTSEVTVSVTWPEKVEGLVKFGKATADAKENSYFTPSQLKVAGNVTTYVVQDGKLGDDDWKENGVIVDPVVPLVKTVATDPGNVKPVPVLNVAGLALLSLFASVMGFAGLRRRKSV